MLGLFRRKKPEASTDAKQGLFTRLKQGLSKTRNKLGSGIASLFLGKKTIDDELLEELETCLISADLGVDVSLKVIESLTASVARKELSEPTALYSALTQQLLSIIEPVQQPLHIDASKKPYVILMVGINGAGKTTTIGKLAKRFLNQNHSVMLAAGDTFRAAAVEQLQTWGERNNVPVIAQPTGSDSASVLFDAYTSAQAKNIDVLIADTAGRLHTQDKLMEELKKIKRVLQKIDPSAPHEVLLVLDASIGQNALNQAQEFNKAVNVTGLALTKLDGTAKGGIVFAIANDLQLPIRFIGIGEQVDDLRDFNAKDFIAALLEQEQHD